MTQQKRKKAVQMVTPTLVFKYPKISEIDYGSKEYPKPDGEYSVLGVMRADAPETKKFLSQLQPHFDEALEEAERQFKSLKVETRKRLGKVSVNDFYTELYDQETEQPTGEIQFKFAMNAGGTIKKGPRAGEKWSAKPGIVDGMGQTIAKCPAIWGGTVGRVSFQINPYFISGTGVAGIKLKLVGVQIIDLKTAGERSAASMGFGAVEGGFDASTYESEDDEAEGSDDGDDFGEGSDDAIDDEIEF